MIIEIRLLEEDAKRKGYPFDGFKKWLNTFIPGPAPIFKTWDIFQDKTEDGRDFFIFRTFVADTLNKRIARGQSE